MNQMIDGKEIELPDDGQRVFVTKGWFGLRGQQVCVIPEATDAEILAACNRENPQLVAGGWHTVVNTAEQGRKLGLSGADPGPCKECPGRIHKIVICM